LGFHPDGDFKAAGINHSSYLSWIALTPPTPLLKLDAIPVLDERSASFCPGNCPTIPEDLWRWFAPLVQQVQISHQL